MTMNPITGKRDQRRHFRVVRELCEDTPALTPRIPRRPGEITAIATRPDRNVRLPDRCATSQAIALPRRRRRSEDRDADAAGGKRRRSRHERRPPGERRKAPNAPRAVARRRLPAAAPPVLRGARRGTPARRQSTHTENRHARYQCRDEARRMKMPTPTDAGDDDGCRVER